MDPKIKKVAIIGAGVSGICAAKFLLHTTTKIKFSVVVYEQRDCIGGTWAYQEFVDLDSEVISSMYKNLRTNLPKQLMYFPDFPYTNEGLSFLHHQDILKYLQDYADHFSVTDHILFNMKVLKVAPVFDECQKLIEWKVFAENLKSKLKLERVFDAVIVCNGHFSTPNMPEIAGLERYKGVSFHSCYYRCSSSFKGKTVLLHGAGSSALDIGLDLASECCSVIISHYGPRFTTKLPPNVIEKVNISHVNADGVFIFEDKTEAAVDVFLPCTGYKYNLSFLSPECEVIYENQTVFPLYKHLFHIKYPSLSFVGIPWLTSPLPMIHQQCAYICSVLSEEKYLPSEEEMLNNVLQDVLELQKKGEKSKHFHKLGDDQFAYNDNLAEFSGCPKNPPFMKDLYKYCSLLRKENAMVYKNYNFKIIDEFTFEVVEQ